MFRFDFQGVDLEDDDGASLGPQDSAGIPSEDPELKAGTTDPDSEAYREWTFDELVSLGCKHVTLQGLTLCMFPASIHTSQDLVLSNTDRPYFDSAASGSLRRTVSASRQFGRYIRSQADPVD